MSVRAEIYVRERDLRRNNVALAIGFVKGVELVVGELQLIFNESAVDIVELRDQATSTDVVVRIEPHCSRLPKEHFFPNILLDQSIALLAGHGSKRGCRRIHVKAGIAVYQEQHECSLIDAYFVATRRILAPGPLERHEQRDPDEHEVQEWLAQDIPHGDRPCL